MIHLFKHLQVKQDVLWALVFLWSMKSCFDLNPYSGHLHLKEYVSTVLGCLKTCYFYRQVLSQTFCEISSLVSSNYFNAIQAFHRHVFWPWLCQLFMYQLSYVKQFQTLILFTHIWVAFILPLQAEFWIHINCPKVQIMAVQAWVHSLLTSSSFYNEEFSQSLFFKLQIKDSLVNCKTDLACQKLHFKEINQKTRVQIRIRTASLLISLLLLFLFLLSHPYLSICWLPS